MSKATEILETIKQFDEAEATLLKHSDGTYSISRGGKHLDKQGKWHSTDSLKKFDHWKGITHETEKSARENAEKHKIEVK